MPEYSSKTDFNSFTTTSNVELLTWNGSPFLFNLSDKELKNYYDLNVFYSIQVMKHHIENYKENCIKCTKCNCLCEKSNIIVYNCGHTFCKTCNRENKDNCPECLNKITQRIQLHN